MQTRFTAEQLARPDIREADSILRKCVHCGFCTATCPTYQELGDERDSPRGRIYLIKEMLESDAAPAPATVTHIDRCLTCLNCMTTCPSGVHYMHLVDVARDYIAEHGSRPLYDRLLRRGLATVMPRPALFRPLMRLARLVRPLAVVFPGSLKAMLRSVPGRIPAPSPVDRPQVHAAQGERRRRVALLTGCVQPVLNPEINEATVRLLTKLGCDVVIPENVGCCGALTHHMGMEDKALASARNNVAAWASLDVDAIVVNASGCGTMVKDYGHLLRDDPDWAERAAYVSSRARDVSELLAELDVPETTAPETIAIAYHAACSLQHGQSITEQPKALLRRAGFDVREVPEGHLCCGSAGTYSLLQPDMAKRLQARKVGNIDRTGADIVAAGNIGCIEHIAQASDRPVVHTVQLIDWALGGPKPSRLTAK
jgi:glycolate oxidase iron-sulfur subunit